MPNLVQLLSDQYVGKVSAVTVSTAYDATGVEDSATKVAKGLVDAASEFDPVVFAEHLSKDALYIFSGRILEGRQVVEDYFFFAWERIGDGSYTIEDLDVLELGQNSAVVKNTCVVLLKYDYTF